MKYNKDNLINATEVKISGEWYKIDQVFDTCVNVHKKEGKYENLKIGITTDFKRPIHPMTWHIPFAMIEDAKILQSKNKVGVIVGRFQCPYLHGGYKDLIDYVAGKSDLIVILIGISPLDGKTEKNPLSYKYRSNIIKKYCDEKNITALIYYIKDVYNVEKWSKNLDIICGSFIIQHFGFNYSQNSEITLYGSRDSFQYTGIYKKEIMPSIQSISSTEIRNKITEKNSPDFASGVIYALNQQYPTVYTTVDVAIMDRGYRSLLLCKKQNEDGWRFVGGFSDPKSNNFEEDAIREVKEETGIDVKNPRYLANINIDDPRYRGTKHQIRTMFFVANVDRDVKFKAQDDIEKLQWFNINDLPNIEKIHIPLLKELF